MLGLSVRRIAYTPVGSIADQRPSVHTYRYRRPLDQLARQTSARPVDGFRQLEYVIRHSPQAVRRERRNGGVVVVGTGPENIRDSHGPLVGRSACPYDASMLRLRCRISGPGGW